MNAPEYDVIVIGGGPAGYMAAIKAARLGGKVLLAEKDELGGTCLNRGCIPAKTFLKSAEIIHELSGAAERGIRIADPGVKMDMPRAVLSKNKVVKKLTGGVGSLLAADGIKVVKGEGRLLSPGQVEVRGEGKFSARKIILAGGSRVMRPPIPGAEHSGVLTSDELLDIQEVPSRLIIVGGGVIGVEMAMIFTAFGSRVSLFEMAPRILPFMDGEISDLIHKILKKRGVEIRTGAGAAGIERHGGELTLVPETGAPISAEKILLSIGRTGDLSCLGDVVLKTEKGKVLVDDTMETSIPGIYAPGDLNGRKMLAHAAYKMGEIAAINAMAGGDVPPVKADLRFVPSVVYSFPEAAGVGLTREELSGRPGIAVGKFPLAANGRALSAGASEGFIKILADPRYGEILGVHMAGPGASEIINEAAALMAMEVTVHELAEIIHGHPTISEALMEAAADCLGHCLHLPPVKNNL